jgi:hypothetical protein
MPIKRFRPVFVGAIFAAVAVLAACGGTDTASDPVSSEGSDGDGGLPVATSQVDFETCSGFLDAAQVAEAAGRDDVTFADRNSNSGPGEGPVTALCVIEYVTPDSGSGSGHALTLLVVSFATEGDAEAHYSTVLGEIRSMREGINPDAQFSENVLGSASYAVTLNDQGVGSVLGFFERDFVVQFNSTVPPGGQPLVSPEAMVPLARQVLANLTGE